MIHLYEAKRISKYTKTEKGILVVRRTLAERSDNKVLLFSKYRVSFWVEEMFWR